MNNLTLASSAIGALLGIMLSDAFIAWRDNAQEALDDAAWHHEMTVDDPIMKREAAAASAAMNAAMALKMDAP